MMNADLREYLLSFSHDERITAWHMAIIYGILMLSDGDNISLPIQISRERVMRHAHVNSYMTYHKCMKELQQFGYIKYFPSYHPALGSKVILAHPQN